MEPNDTSGPGEHLLTHEAPDDLLQKAWVRSAQPPRHPARTALVAATLLLVGAVVGRALPQPDTDAPLVLAVQDIGAQAEPSAVIPVRLVCACPDARSAAVAGTWNGWDPKTAPMEQVAEGLFATTVYLSPGRHEYMFVLDGDRWVTDQVAANWQDDGFGSRNAIVEI
ncbi:MAG: isoamylase early set domain-containing protein [Deltaproteobacteria bacterium]|nr:isoamylase early set domain-containing protein [Deltaproteobacteria bacterium]